MEHRRHRAARKVAFWGGVAVVAVLANFYAEALIGGLAERTKAPPGLAQLIAFTHRGAN